MGLWYQVHYLDHGHYPNPNLNPNPNPKHHTMSVVYCIPSAGPDDVPDPCYVAWTCFSASICMIFDNIRLTKILTLIES